MSLLVPAFVIQPLVENAVQHGIRPSGPLHITLSVKRGSDDRVRLLVVDDGRGITKEDLPRVLDAGFGRGLGIALKNVDDRVKGHFGPDSGLSVTSVEGQGTTVTLTLASDAAPEGTG